MEDDLLLAIRLQEQFDREDRDHREPDHREVQRPLSIVDESWEVLDPNPDVRALFLDFNQRFFWGKLSGVEVKWSPRMTLCAGVCSYEGRGGLCSIRLSEPLLKLRPRKDLVETLLHEMIHALLFVTQNDRDRDGHGPEFRKHMDRINRAGGTRITVYHSFHDEVDVYRRHWWRCDGPCAARPPYYGWVKRAMNRAPSPLDPWWEDHRRTCGGSYTKVKEPEGYGKRGNKRGNKDKEGNKEKKLETTGSKSLTTGSASTDVGSVIPFSGRGFLLGGNSSSFGTPTSVPASSPGPSSGVRPQKKTSVANAGAFVNIAGSPVRIPKPPKPPGTSGDRGKQKSIRELFGGSTARPGANGEPSVGRSVGSARGTSRWGPHRPRGGSPAAGPSKRTSIQELLRRSSSKNPGGRPDANAAATVVTEAGAVPSPLVRFGTDVPRGGSPGPPRSKFFTGSHGEAAPAGSPASRKRSWDRANVPDLEAPVSSSLTVSCPVCQVIVQESKINEHLDSCLS